MKNNIRIERAILRISQQELANAIGVSRQTIFAIENNKFIPSTELALKLSAYFGKSVNELFQL
ncbi:MAG: helix-turn-helix transcriptional regulator [Bacteroidaceae bacterium]|jgi:putative transcriptional regulator|nr:helix-turn-helix transcriptional regulator [Bacteroidaceae bacterium]MBP8602374.1 helix-turn-helix transcriptional regulator [Bacteroidaceae bacterium]HBA13044.1 transcriptional regulator [Bacteroidales bacterium]HOD68820.1 helix-turn-helix transcriptional regulator [Bacteroidaceae bacterium]HQL26300.1 helix-turn-helix transcriptional regulator [Bacteroidaceae bacterium]